MALNKAQLMETPGGPGVIGAIKAGQNIAISPDGTISASAGGQPIGTVTSAGVDPGTTGMVFQSSPVTSSGTITTSGVLAVQHGGTGATTQEGAANGVLPPQTAGTNGYFLTTNGTTTSWGPITSPGSFPSGTSMLFVQAAPPTGWTLNVANNDAALRVSASGGGGVGGSMDFSVVFNTRTIPLVDHTHGVNQGSGHVHVYTRANSQNIQHGQQQGKTSANDGLSGNTTGAALVNLSVFSASQSGQTTGNTMDFNIQYVDVISCTKI